MILFSHHAIQSLTANVPDEAAPPCTSTDSHGHDVNPGCDVDPRNSQPIHLGEDLTDAPAPSTRNVIAWVAGPQPRQRRHALHEPGADGGFWRIRTAAEADWPQQSRLFEVFDNEDGTLSIFGTILDHAAPPTAPPAGTDASTLDVDGLASVGRTIAFNDNQTGSGCGTTICGEGQAEDRNVELLVRDPRRGPLLAGRCANRRTGTAKADNLDGTVRGDRLNARGGKDRVRAFAGNDCVAAGKGADTVSAGKGRDRVAG